MLRDERFERAAEIAEIAEIAETSERPINPGVTEGVDEFGVGAFRRSSILQRREWLEVAAHRNSGSLGALRREQRLNAVRSTHPKSLFSPSAISAISAISAAFREPLRGALSALGGRRSARVGR